MTVSQLTDYIDGVFSNDEQLSRLLVKGEITNLSNSNSGHIYFSLKDEDSMVSCAFFKGHNQKLEFKLENGLEVIVQGSVSIYGKRSTYQISVFSVYPIGEGALFLKFKQLKERLETEGLFDPKHKKRIPAMPESIGLITSKGSNAYHDIIQVIESRFPHVRVKLINTATQGEHASDGMADAIRTFNERKDVDVILLSRGGGSMEDLMCFNDENLARAIYDSDIPVVSAVGHEADYTIADFVSDLRAPTPSLGAKCVIPDASEIKERISLLRGRLKTSYENYVHIKESKKRALEIKKREKEIRAYKIAIAILILLAALFVAWLVMKR
jgi:exodeoxyribonuclease VII large subunit